MEKKSSAEKSMKILFWLIKKVWQKGFRIPLKKKKIVQKKFSVRLKKSRLPSKKTSVNIFSVIFQKKSCEKRFSVSLSLSLSLLNFLKMFASSVREKKHEKEFWWKNSNPIIRDTVKKIKDISDVRSNEKRAKKTWKKDSPIQSIYIYLIKKIVCLPGYSFRP